MYSSNPKELTCLQSCIKGMDKRLIQFYKKNTGILKFINLIGRTKNERIHHLLYFYNGYYLAMGLSSLTNSQPDDVRQCMELLDSPAFKMFEAELIETLKQNQDLLIGKLTPKLQRKLNSLIAV